jgi:hypothetical protein
LIINGVNSREYAVNSSTAISGSINWVNNLDTQVNNLVITTKLSGNALDRKTINVEQGYYDSSTDTITWDKNSENGFTAVNPRDSGSVNFSFSPLSVVSDAGGMLSAPTINIVVSISAVQPQEGNMVQNLVNSDSKIIRIISNVGLSGKVLYYSGAFTNTGAIPPKVEKETTYTVDWGLSNTANNISGAQVVATLPAWVRFVGPVSPPSENLTFDPTTRSIIWNIGGIPKGTGISDTGRTVSFQIGFTPSLSQVGTMPVLINEAALTGHDDFANVDVKVSKIGLNTLLLDDPTFTPDGGRVVN